MEDILFSPTGAMLQLLLLMFFWAPFAFGAYLEESWDPQRARHAMQRLIHPLRHTAPARPATHAA